MNAETKQSILAAVAESQIVLISSSTPLEHSSQQVPQIFLVDSDDHQTNILCTQPRRKTAVDLAERVAAQRSEAVGHIVGFQIRSEQKTSEATRLTYCTTGALRRRLQDDDAKTSLAGVSHVVVGEAHEEGEETDLMVPLLKEALKIRTDLRVILLTDERNKDRVAGEFGGAKVLVY